MFKRVPPEDVETPINARQVNTYRAPVNTDPVVRPESSARPACAAVTGIPTPRGHLARKNAFPSCLRAKSFYIAV